MKIEKSYLVLAPFFDLWVRIMEIQTRALELQDSSINKVKILIISPPTDRGIKILTQANPDSESQLLCFSEALGELAKKYAIRHAIENLRICVEPFFSIPFPAHHFDAVYANCLFDFCPEHRFDGMLGEIKRTLKSRGLFFSVYMDQPADTVGRTWANLCGRFPLLSQGCHPVDIIPYLVKRGFKLKKNVSLGSFGFPLKYLMARG